MIFKSARVIVVCFCTLLLSGYGSIADEPPTPKNYSSIWDMQDLGSSFYIRPPKTIKDSLPEYPPVGQKMGLNGKVQIEIFINEKGEFEGARILSTTNPIFNECVLKAAKNWMFTPTTTDQGKKLIVFLTRTVTFTCEQPEGKEKVRLVNGKTTAVIRLYPPPPQYSDGLD